MLHRSCYTNHVTQSVYKDCESPAVLAMKVCSLKKASIWIEYCYSMSAYSTPEVFSSSFAFWLQYSFAKLCLPAQVWNFVFTRQDFPPHNPILVGNPLAGILGDSELQWVANVYVLIQMAGILLDTVHSIKNFRCFFWWRYSHYFPHVRTKELHSIPRLLTMSGHSDLPLSPIGSEPGLKSVRDWISRPKMNLFLNSRTWPNRYVCGGWTGLDRPWLIHAWY